MGRLVLRGVAFAFGDARTGRSASSRRARSWSSVRRRSTPSATTCARSRRPPRARPSPCARVTRALAAFRGLALVVSHDRTFLDAATQGTLRVHNGGVDVYILPYSLARAAWERDARAQGDERSARKDDHAAALRKLAEARDRRAGADANRSSGRRMKNKNDHDARSMGAKFVIERAEHRLGRLVGARKSEALRAAEAIPAFEGERAVGRSIFVDDTLATRLTCERWVVSDGSLRSGRASSSRAAPSGSSPSPAHRRACAQGPAR